MNRFLYAEGNPATLIDPTGHYAQGQLCPYGPGECGSWKPGHYTTTAKPTGSGGRSGPAYPLTTAWKTPTPPAAVGLTSGVTRTSPGGANFNDTRRHTSFTYDPYGNLTAKAESASTLTAMAYDAAGRLVSITPASGASAVFTLDALGRHRTRVLSAGGTDTYAYLGSSATVHEISNSATGTTRSLLDIDGTRLAVKTGAAAATFTLFDQLGSLIALVDGTRTITGATRYDCYGETVGSAGSTTSPWRFRGNLDVSPSGDPLLGTA
jgi:YD repeat-containing protein